MKIRDVMRPGAFTVGEHDCLGDAHEIMMRARVRHLPVTTGDRVVGMVSERDILGARARGHDGDWWSVEIRSVMRSPAHTAHPDDSLTEVAGRMAAEKIGAIPVTELGKLVGIATVTDVLEAEVRAAAMPRPKGALVVADAMTAYPLVVHPNVRLADAATTMLRKHVRHLPVVDTGSAIVGMLSERDVRGVVGDPAGYVEFARAAIGLRVRDVATVPAKVIAFDRPLVEVAKQFADERLEALAVVDGFGALIGILSYIDLLRLLAT